MSFLYSYGYIYIYIICCHLSECDVLNESFVIDEHIEMSDDDNEDTDCEEHWNISDEELSRDYDFEEHQVNETSAKKSNIYVFILFMFLCASFYGVSAAALNHLIQFISQILQNFAVDLPLVTAAVTTFPKSLYKMRKYFGLGKDKFTKYRIARNFGRGKLWRIFSQCILASKTLANSYGSTFSI